MNIYINIKINMIKNIYVYIILIIILLLIFIGLNIYLNSYYINYKKQNNFLKNNTGINEYFYSNFDEIMDQMDDSLFNELDQSANEENNIDEDYLKQNDEINNGVDNNGINNDGISLISNNDNVQRAPIISNGNLYSIRQGEPHPDRNPRTNRRNNRNRSSRTNNRSSRTNNRSSRTNNRSSRTNNISSRTNNISSIIPISSSITCDYNNSSSSLCNSSSISSSNTCCIKEPKPLHPTVCGKHYDICRVDEEGNDSCCNGYSCLRPMGNFGVKKCLNDSDKGFPYKVPDVDATGYYDLTVVKNDYSKLLLPNIDTSNIGKTFEKINPANLFKNMFKCKADSKKNKS